MIFVLINYSLSLSNSLPDGSSTNNIILFLLIIFIYTILFYTGTILSYCSQAMLKKSNLILIHLI